MNQELKTALEHEKIAQNYSKNVKQKIVDNVASVGPEDGVTIPKDTSLQIAIVKFSALKEGLNLAPSTYIPKAQAEAVKRRLDSCNSVQHVLDAVTEMVSTSKIRFSNGNYVTLNGNTTKVLSAYLGS